jgi:RNA polymerase sigma-70 factor, ECF subfamily
MTSRAPSGAESDIQAHLRAGEHERAVTLAIRRFGPEILGFLATTERDEDAAGDIFAQFCEDLWKGAPRYRGEAAFRTFAYALARNAAHRHRRDPYRRRRVELDESSPIPALVYEVRSSSMSGIRRELAEGVSRLRAELEPDEQALLVLRVDRGMAWIDVSRVLDGDPADEGELKRRAAAWRQRYGRLRERLRERAEAAGLVLRKA